MAFPSGDHRGPGLPSLTQHACTTPAVYSLRLPFAASTTSSTRFPCEVANVATDFPSGDQNGASGWNSGGTISRDPPLSISASRTAFFTYVPLATSERAPFQLGRNAQPTSPGAATLKRLTGTPRASATT